MLGFTRHLPAHGWSCSVVCAGPEDYWLRDRGLLARVPSDVEVVRVAEPGLLSSWVRLTPGDPGRRSGPAFGALRSLGDWWLVPDAYLAWARRARARAARLLARGGFDAILSSSPPDSLHVAAGSLRRRSGLPWVADFRDPWMGLYSRRPPTRWHRRRHALLERRAIESASLVLAASRAHADDLCARFRDQAGKIVHLPNGYEPDPDVAGGAPAPRGRSGRFLLAFTGMMWQTPDTEVFLEALHQLLARRPAARRTLRARLAGPFESGYADRAVALGLTGIVEFAGPLPHAEARALQREADLLLLWKPRGIPARVPGRVYEYVDAGRPIAALLEPGDETADLVRSAGGEVVPAGGSGPLADAIERRYAAWEAGATPEAKRPPWIEEHTRERLAARLAHLLDGLARGGA